MTVRYLRIALDLPLRYATGEVMIDMHKLMRQTTLAWVGMILLNAGLSVLQLTSLHALGVIAFTLGWLLLFCGMVWQLWTIRAEIQSAERKLTMEEIEDIKSRA